MGSSRLPAGLSEPGLVGAGAQSGSSNGPRSRRPIPPPFTPTPGIAGGWTRRPRLCRLGAVTGPRPGGFRIQPPTPVELPPPPVRSVGPAAENEGGNATQTRPLRQGGSFLLPNSVPSPKQPPQTESFTKPPRPDKPPFRKRGVGGINPHATTTKRKNHQPTPGERKPPFRKRGVGGINPHATTTKRKNHQPTPGERKPPFRKRGVGGITPTPAAAIQHFRQATPAGVPQCITPVWMRPRR